MVETRDYEVVAAVAWAYPFEGEYHWALPIEPDRFHPDWWRDFRTLCLEEVEVVGWLPDSLGTRSS